MNVSCLSRALAALSMIVAAPSFAGAALSVAHVVAVRVDANGMGMIIFDQPLAGTPAACGQSSGYNNALAFNATTGKSALALALSAKATGSAVEVYGTGACGTYGAWVEDYSYGVIR